MGEVKFNIPLWNTVVQHQVQQMQDTSRRGRVTVNLLWVTAGAVEFGTCSAEEINSFAGSKAVVMHALETEADSFVLVYFGIACYLHCC